MAFLFDTNAISEILRRHPNPELVRWLSTLPRDQQFTSAIVCGELLSGARGTQHPSLWLRRYRTQVFPRLTILPFDFACAEAYGDVRAQLRASGRPIGEPDTLIAATALAHGLTIVTANVKHFARIPGLELRPFRPGRQR